MRKLSLTLLTSLAIAGAAHAQWTSITSGTIATLYSCSFATPTTVYAAGGLGIDSATILKSVNGGASFYHLNAAFIPAGQMIFSSAFTSADTGFVAGGDPLSPAGFIYRTVNGGASWTSVLSSSVATLRSIQFTSAGIGYACGGNNATGVIYRTTNGGTTWTPIFSSGSPSMSLGKEYFLNDTTGFAIGRNSTAAKSRLASVTHGATVTTTDFAPYAYFSAVCFRSPDTGFVCTADTGTGGVMHMLKTVDGGATWTSVYTGTASYQGYSLQFADAMHGYMVGDRNLQTTDGGNSWSTFTPMTAGPSLYDIRFSGTLGIIVGEGGTILRTGSVTGIAPAAGAATVTLSPNPLTQQATLTFSREQTNTAIRITDLTGRTVRTTTFTGTTLTIARGDLATGAYLLTCQPTNGAPTTLKIEVQ